jgi:hypothetical protein
MPITKATSNVVDLNKDTTINGINVGKGNNSIATNTALGITTLLNNTDGNNNTAIGWQSLKSNTGGDHNTAIGVNSLTSIATNSCSNNVAIGSTCANSATQNFSQNVAVGFYALSSAISGDGNTAVGTYTLFNNSGGLSNTAIGYYSSYTLSQGFDNTSIGYNSFLTSNNMSNSTGVGSGAEVTGSNQVQLGKSTTTTYVYGTVQNRSDIRDKADIRDTQLGLDFIKELRPVDYKYDLREDYRPEMPQAPDSDASEEEKAAYEIAKAKWLEDSKLENITHDGSNKRTRYHHGLIAQEVKTVMDAKGIDFGGYQDHKIKGGDDVLSIGYDELIAPMIKAIQELSAEVASLKAQLNP